MLTISASERRKERTIEKLQDAVTVILFSTFASMIVSAVLIAAYNIFVK